MHFNSLFLSIAVIAMGTKGATVPRQTDPHLVNFRTYGLPGCSAENQGVYTYTQSHLDICYQFSTVNIVESIFVSDITDGCSVYAYTDAACAENQVTVPVGIENCYDYAAGLYSYKMVCT